MSDRCTRSNANAAWTCVLPEGHEGDHIYTLWSEIAIHAEAAIQRVRDLCEDKTREVAASDPLFGPPLTLYVDDILRALNGGAE